MFKHIREVIHVVGSYDRFRKIVKMAIDTDASGKYVDLQKAKAMPAGAASVGTAATANNTSGASQVAGSNAQPDTIHDLQRMMRRVKDDIEKKMLGKDEDTNIFKAINLEKELMGGAIAQSNDDNKE